MLYHIGWLMLAVVFWLGFYLFMEMHREVVRNWDASWNNWHYACIGLCALLAAVGTIGLLFAVE